VDELASFSMSFNSGILASLNSGFTVNAKREAVIYGTRGRIVVENCYGPQWCDRFDENDLLVEHFEEPVPDGLFTRSSTASICWVTGRVFTCKPGPKWMKRLRDRKRSHWWCR